ncbi:hypothetical protein TNIN_443211 [Trichonephila inaurata madagascariensis]|uniref:Uncharacterized protein n=1 Tax=Trichonephila inaurata madagascariensis TaxID=2747483 RepID=A0A8X6YJN3_9ARAC|nr:hypothetical protein TNIN_443211 [Trichonephila inaurata madagascariensis]
MRSPKFSLSYQKVISKEEFWDWSTANDIQKEHRKSGDSKETFLHRLRKIKIRKEGHLTEITIREGCRHPPRQTNRLKRETERRRRKLDRFQSQVPGPVQLRKGRSSQAGSR